MTDHAIEADGVRHCYGDRVANDGVDFRVRRGSVHAFLGPNGSGKSTLFKVLATIYALQEGRVTVLGRDLAREAASLRAELGVVFQSPAVDKKLSVRRNLRYAGQLFGLRGPSLDADIDQMLARAGLTDRANDKVAELSGGLRRRVELAKCLLHEPKLLLLDEPSTGLDPGARADLWRLLREVEGLTVVYTTHLMDEAEDADHVTILNEGRVVADGAPAELRASLGEQVLEIGCDDPAALAARVADKFGLEVASLDDAVRIQRDDAHRLVGDLVDAFGTEVQRVTVSHPSLEDVYIARTGHRFWTEEAAS